MKRRSARPKRAKSRGSKTKTQRPRGGLKATRPRNSSAADHKTQSDIAQLTLERDEALEREKATAEVLRVISSSPRELDLVFKTMLENALHICEAEFGVLYRYDGDGRFHAAVWRGVSSIYEEVLRQRGSFRPNVGTILDRLLLARQLIHNPNASLDRGNAAVMYGGARSLILVPMEKEGELVGAFVIYRTEARPFTERQIALVTNFAAQAVIAIENARLLNELSESLRQRTATSEVLGVISSSPGELQPVFDAVLGNALRVCDAKFGTLFSYDGDGRFRMAARRNLPPAYEEVLRQRGSFRPKVGTVNDALLQTGQLVHKADASVDLVDAAAVYGGARSLIAVPIGKKGELVGSIVIYRTEVRSFSEKQIELVINFAAHAAVAIENTRLLNELRARTGELARSVEELRALGEVSQTVNSTLDLEAVLSAIVSKAAQLSGTEAGAIYVFSEAKREHQLRATYGMTESLIDALKNQHAEISEAIALAIEQHQPMQTPDLRSEPPSPARDILLQAGYLARLIVPLLAADRIVGALVVRRKAPGAFVQNTVELMKTFAAQSVLAIQNARLFANVEARTGELAQSLQDLRTAQDRLVQTEKLASLGQLTAGIAHEIKNPLNFVNNFSAVSAELIDELQEAMQGIQIDEKKRSEVAELADMLRGNLDKVVQHGKRADSIVKNMLLHSRQGSGEHQPADINAIVEESLNLAYHGARAEKQGFNITLERSLDPAAGEVDLFPQEITRVLLNLISNGFYAAMKRKAEADGGDYEPKLAATTKNLGDSVEIRIRDNGTGIPPEVREKMFNPFYTTKPAGEGTGLGLSLSHDIIVRQHAGSIEVDTRPGEFTEFRIVLPRKAAVIGKLGERA